MLLKCRRLAELDFSKLMYVYEEGNVENGSEKYPGLPANRQLLQAEQDFYGYLQEVFFPTPGAVYMVWEEEDCYCSALRLEPYGDGLLLSALETAPALRRKGYAARLIRSVMQELGKKSPVTVYSHVSKKNIASLHTHLACGFEIVKDHAVYLDGSVTHNACTLCAYTPSL